MTTTTLREAAPGDLAVIAGILAIAGEHMHRVQDRSHWYPFRSAERFAERLEGRTSYLVQLDDVVAGTYDLSEQAEPGPRCLTSLRLA